MLRQPLLIDARNFAISALGLVAYHVSITASVLNPRLASRSASQLASCVKDEMGQWAVAASVGE